MSIKWHLSNQDSTLTVCSFHDSHKIQSQIATQSSTNQLLTNLLRAPRCSIKNNPEIPKALYKEILWLTLKINQSQSHQPPKLIPALFKHFQPTIISKIRKINHQTSRDQVQVLLCLPINAARLTSYKPHKSSIS